MFQSPDFTILQERINRSTPSDVEAALSARRVSEDHLAALLSPAAEPYLKEMAARAAEITLNRFGRTIQLYAPIYLSNYCTNRCVYCGFSADNRIKRKCLTLDEAEAEAEILRARGFQHILLVSGEAENAVDTDYMEAIALRLRDKFAAVSIEIQPLSKENYRRLFQAGITAVAVYQETYDRDLYSQVHLSGKKVISITGSRPRNVRPQPVCGKWGLGHYSDSPTGGPKVWRSPHTSSGCAKISGPPPLRSPFPECARPPGNSIRCSR